MTWIGRLYQRLFGPPIPLDDPAATEGFSGVRAALDDGAADWAPLPVEFVDDGCAGDDDA